MALFYYQALERNGRKTKGMIEADSARHARQLLRGKELIPVHIEARMNTSSGGMLQRRRHAHRRVAAADLALFTRQLATLVQAAMPLETCLQAVSEQSEKLHVKSLGMALRSRIQEGYTLSDSLAVYEYRNGAYYQSTLARVQDLARDLARPGDAVLLSPACASWDSSSAAATARTTRPASPPSWKNCSPGAMPSSPAAACRSGRRIICP